MKIGYLTDSNGRLTNLANAIRLEIVDGAKEIIPLAYGKLSDIPRLDILVGKNFYKVKYFSQKLCGVFNRWR